MKSHVVVLFLCSLLFPLMVNAQQRPDTTGIPEVEDPVYEMGKGPVICIDAAHNNFHRLDTGFAPFALLLQKDGYRFKSSDNIFENGVPENCRIFVIANAQHESNLGNWTLPVANAFSEKEVSIIKKWVSEGGSLFLIADHMPFPGAANDLAAAFGFVFNNGFAMKRQQTWPPAVFRKSDKTLEPSEFTNGIDSVATYTGQAFKIPDQAVPVLTFGDDHFTLMPDTAWQFSADTPQHSVEGWSQGAIMEFGQGRLAVFGEAAMFTSQTAGNRRVGFTDPNAPQNAQFLLNIIHWLD